MKLFRTCGLSLLGAALAFALTVSSVRALPPIGKTVKVSPKTKKATPEEKLTNGMKLVVTLNDKTSVSGTVVWADDAADYLLLRTKPGTLPRKIMGKNIADITRIRLTSDSGSVLPDEPEIHMVTMYNGARTVRYFAPTLSSAEKAKLTELEIAENETGRAEYMMSLALQTLREETQSAREKSISRARRNELMGVQAYWYSAGPYYYAPFAYYDLPRFGTGYSASTPSLAETVLTKDIPLANRVSKLRRELAQLQNQGLYQDGRLVAVLVESQK